jgi:Flp pilus assembly protein TadG
MISRKLARAGRRGATVVEMAIVMSVTITIMMAIYEYGRYFMMSQMVNSAVRAGARLAVATTNTQSTTAVQSLVMQYLGGLNLKNSSGAALSTADVSVYQAVASTGAQASDSTWYDAQFGSPIVVTVSAKFTPMFPTFGFLPSSFTVKGTAMMNSEAN